MPNQIAATLIKITFILLLIGTSIYCSGQGTLISGIVSSSSDNGPIPAATVMLLMRADSSLVTGTVTDFEGQFEVETKLGDYILKIQYIGHEPYTKPVHLTAKPLDMGDITIQETSIFLSQVTIQARRATGVMKGDTSQFDAAAFKTMKDASAQSLIEKLPGINDDNGSLQAEGENIVQILVDGKPFFGQDVNAALQNLPAEIIASVQIYDKLSDKAELSGFDDGEREKTINIITKPNRRTGQFGKFSGGYGSDDRYLIGSSVNFFKEGRRITFTGLSNNVNTLGYSADANSDGQVRPQNGIINTQTLGVNYNDNWGESIEVSGSYQFSQRRNNGNSIKVRDYILPSSEGQEYIERSNDISKNVDHRFNFRLDYDIDENNRLLFRPYATIQDDTEESYFLGATTVVEDPLNQTENTRTASNYEGEVGARLLYSHKFAKKGRSISMNFRGEHQNGDDLSKRQAENMYYDETNHSELLNQLTTNINNGLNLESNFSYTEPVGERGQLELEYKIDNNNNDSERLTYDIIDDQDPLMIETFLDTSLSNTFNSQYLSQEVELGYQYKYKKIKLQVEAEYQKTDLNNDQVFPYAYDINRKFENFSPTVRIDYQFSKNNRLDIDYDTYTRTPRISQLQDVINVSNPLRLSTGNPELDQTYTNRFRVRYRNRNPETDQSFYLYLSSSITDNYISSSSTIAEEALPISEDIILEKGSQLTKPVNVDGYFELRSYINTGMPVQFIKSNANIWTSINHSRKPGIINDQLNFVKNTSLRLGLTVSSNISENIDFRVSTRSAYNITENTLNPTVNNNYFYQNSRVTYNWIIWEDMVYRLDLNHKYNKGLSEDINNTSLLMNMSIGTKVFKDRRGELSLKVYDLFKQNNNIRRNVTALYIEDSESNVLQRYFMLSLHYNLRHFNKGTTEKDYHDLHGD